MGEMASLLKERVEMFTKDVVDRPELVNVIVTVETKEINIQIKVDQKDCGKIIGKNGRTIEALKILCLAIKNTQFSGDARRIRLGVLEDENNSFSYRRN